MAQAPTPTLPPGHNLGRDESATENVRMDYEERKMKLTLVIVS